MKRFTLVLVALTMLSSIALAACWMVDQKVVPPVALPDAYRLAIIALGSSTNEFHCTAAEFVGEYGPPGSWRFSFFGTNAARKTIWACPDGSTHIQVGPIAIY